MVIALCFVIMENWNVKVATLTTLWSLAAPEVVTRIISETASDYKVVIVTIFPYSEGFAGYCQSDNLQWRQWVQSYQHNNLSVSVSK